MLRVHSGYTEIIKLRLRPFQVGLLLVCGEQLVSRFYAPLLERAVLCRCVLPNITVSCKRRDKKYKSVQERQLRRWLYEEKVVIVSGGQIRFAFICANNTNVNEGWFLAVQNSSIGDLVTHWLSHSLTHVYFCHTKGNPWDLLPLHYGSIHTIRDIQSF